MSETPSRNLIHPWLTLDRSNVCPGRSRLVLWLRMIANRIRTALYFTLRCPWVRRHGMVRIPWSVRIWSPHYEVFARIHDWHCRGEHGCVQLLNPHSVMLCHRDFAMLRAAQHASLTLPDGMGVILAARLLGLPERGRVTGPTLMLRLCDWGRQHHYRHFFYGGGEGVARELAERLVKAYPGLQVAGTFQPPFRKLTRVEDEAIIQQINRNPPRYRLGWTGCPQAGKMDGQASSADRCRSAYWCWRGL